MTQRKYPEIPVLLCFIRLVLGALLLVCCSMAVAPRARAQESQGNSAPGTAKPAPQPQSLRQNRSKDNASAESDNSPFGSFENSRNRGPVNIQSQSLTMNYKDNSVLFSGNVHAAQADGQLTSNTLNVKYGKDFHEIQEMVADGNVRISQGVRWCTSDHGVMNQAQHTVVLTGDPVCHDENDQISGTKITVHLDTGKSEVEGGVKAVIFPRDSKTRDNKTAPESNQQPAS